MTTTAPTPFVFDRNHHNLDQVTHLWDAYNARYQELKAAGRYPYNADFKGKIDGLIADDKDENSAIYLLQTLRSVREYEARVQALRDQGYIEPEAKAKGTTQVKYASIAIIGLEYMGHQHGSIRIVESGRLVTRDGEPTAVMPKGARSRGYSVTSYVLVKP